MQIDVCNSPQYMFERDVSDTMPDFVAKVPTMPESFPNGRGTMVALMSCSMRLIAPLKPIALRAIVGEC